MAALRVEVVAGLCSDEVAERLREHDVVGLLDVAVLERPGAAAVVVDTRGADADETAADVVLHPDAAVREQVERLWCERLMPFARHAAGIERLRPGPAVLHEHDPDLQIGRAHV